MPREKFAPSRETVREHYDKIKQASDQEKNKLQAAFLGEFPQTHSIAQLNIRVEFLESLDGLTNELKQASAKLLV